MLNFRERLKIKKLEQAFSSVMYKYVEGSDADV